MAEPREHEQEIHGELPRFVELLRMSQGPIDDSFTHCGKRPDVDELEEMVGEGFDVSDSRMRAIWRCSVCGRFYWGWWD